MNAFAALMWRDLRVLYRTGYLAAAVFVFALLLALALQTSKLDLERFADIVSAVILLDLVVTPVLLAGLMLLLERGEGSLAALSVMPASAWMHVAARTVTVSLVGSAEMLALALIAYGGLLNPALLVAGLIGIAALAALAALVVASPFGSLYPFVLPMIGFILFLSVPGYAVFAGWPSQWLVWHPTAPPMALLGAAFADASTARIAYGAVGTAVWLAIGGLLAERAQRFAFQRAAGG